MPGVFAGGDCATVHPQLSKQSQPQRLLQPISMNILDIIMKFRCDVEIPEPHLDDRTPCGRVNLTEREACERVCDFEGVENCMTEKEAKQEASRCLRCDHFGYGIFKEVERHYGKYYNR